VETLLSEIEPGTGEDLTDDAVVARVCAGETARFELIMRRYNRRLYRVARAILRDEHESKDALQEAYVQAYLHLCQFKGHAKLSSWLTGSWSTKHCGAPAGATAWEGRARCPGRGPVRGPGRKPFAPSCGARSSAGRRAAGPFRTAFVLRDVEELNTAETADCLGIPEETVKTRLHRARALLRRTLSAQLGETAREAFPFGFAQCDHVVATVMQRITHLDPQREPTPDPSQI
jgi:RNA polymerase sigma-70 factor (ECF subfamily)